MGMAQALLFTACGLFSLICSPSALAEIIQCTSCLMNFPNEGCKTGEQTCPADLDRGQSCLTIHFSHQGSELYRMQGCTRPDTTNCDTTHNIDDFSVQLNCCTSGELCNSLS